MLEHRGNLLGHSLREFGRNLSFDFVSKFHSYFHSDLIFNFWIDDRIEVFNCYSIGVIFNAVIDQPVVCIMRIVCVIGLIGRHRVQDMVVGNLTCFEGTWLVLLDRALIECVLDFGIVHHLIWIAIEHILIIHVLQNLHG